MKWIRSYKYVDLETGEVTEIGHISKYETDKTIRIVNTTKIIKYATYTSRTIEITKYYRRNEYKQGTIQYTTST